MKHIILTLTLLLSCAVLQATHLEVDPKIIENAPDQFEEVYQQEQAQKAALRELVGDEAYSQLSCAEGTPTVIILNNGCEAKILDRTAYQAASQAAKPSAEGAAACGGILSLIAIILSVLAMAISIAALCKRSKTGSKA